MVSFWQVIILVAVVALSILGGVMAGAYAVFRTKREGYESFIGPAPKGEVFSIDTLGGLDVEDVPPMPETIQKRADAFMDQFGGTK